jgi:hypothetical protein
VPGGVLSQRTLGLVVLCGFRDVFFLKTIREKGEPMADEKEKPVEKKEESTPSNLPPSATERSRILKRWRAALAKA